MPELSPAKRQQAMQHIPSQYHLNVDRRFTAQEVTTDINRWAESPATRDLAGFDTRQEMRSRHYERVRAGYNRPSVFPVEEPDRYFNENSVTRNLLESVKDGIFDYDSFKQSLGQAWQTDVSLRNLVPQMSEEDYNALFRHQQVQYWLNKNVENRGVSIISERNRMAPHEALRIWEQMNQEQRISLLGLSLPPTAREIRPVTQITSPIPEPVMVTRRIGNTTYQRSLGRKWSDLQIRFLLNRRGLPAKRVVDEYGQFWSRSPRSKSSILSKFYRLPKLKRP